MILHVKIVFLEMNESDIPEDPVIYKSMMFVTSSFVKQTSWLTRKVEDNKHNKALDIEFEIYKSHSRWLFCRTKKMR